MTAISQTIFQMHFPWMKIFVFWLKFHWRLFPRVQLTITQHWFRYWLGTESESMLTRSVHQYIYSALGGMSYSIAEQGSLQLGNPSKTHLSSLRLRQNGWCFTDDIFRCIFMNENVNLLIQISLKFAPRCSINRNSLLTKVYQCPSKTSYLGLGNCLHFEHWLWVTKKISAFAHYEIFVRMYRSRLTDCKINRPRESVVRSLKANNNSTYFR